MNASQTNKILVVVHDAVMLEILVDAAAQNFNAHVTCAATGGDALDIDRVEFHHVVLAGVKLTDMSGFDLAQKIMQLRRRPVILIADDPTADDVIRAVRLGVSDFLTTPVDVEYLFTAIDTALRRESAERRRNRRDQRTRSLIRRVLRDRRNLNQRIDLICRDMVGAHRRLFHRVLSFQHSAISGQPKR